MSREPVRTAQRSECRTKPPRLGSRSFAEFTGAVCFSRREIMTTQADSAQALGKSLDGSESSVPPGDYDMQHVTPEDIQGGDVLHWEGLYRVVSTRLKIRGGSNKGGWAIYFREESGGLPHPATIPEDVLAVTVYRPKAGESYV